MTEGARPRPDVDQFLYDQIDTVPHLEALLLLWNGRTRSWSMTEMAERLFLTAEATKEILEDLVRRSLAATSGESVDCYRYEPDSKHDALMAAVDIAYRHELIRVTRLIHSKPSAALRDFARAFRLKKERE